MTSLVSTSLKRWLSGAPERSGNRASVPLLPKGIPDSVEDAYRQACFLLARSPRASGALARYALQKILRDFWQLTAEQQGTIAEELALIDDRLPPETQQSIACVRGFGTIESQLSQDRDLMVEATAGEAKLMIALVQLLAREWYDDRRRRQAHLDAIRAMAAETAQPLRRDEQSGHQAAGNGAPPSSAEETASPQDAAAPADPMQATSEAPASPSGDGESPTRVEGSPS